MILACPNRRWTVKGSTLSFISIVAWVGGHHGDGFLEPNLAYRLYPCMGHAVRRIRTSGHVAKTRLSYVKLGPNVSMTASMFALWFLNTSGREGRGRAIDLRSLMVL